MFLEPNNFSLLRHPKVFSWVCIIIIIFIIIVIIIIISIIIITIIITTINIINLQYQ